MKYAMLDLETFGTDVGCIILQIGSCYFDKDTGKIQETFCENMSPIEGRRLGFNDSMETIQWWMMQNKQAQDSVFYKQKPIIEVLSLFSEFIKNADEIWCHTNFDWPILTRYYKHLYLESPLNYKKANDLRTVLKISKIDLSMYKREGIYHNALDDCIHQISYLINCLKVLKSN